MNTDSSESRPEHLNDVLPLCWELLQRGAKDRRFGFHHPVVSNVTREGTPSARIVILRAAEEATRQLRFHTDIRSPKWQDFAARPAVSFIFYDAEAKVQLRVDGKARLYHGDAVAEAAWAQSQAMSRVCYGSAPGPGQALDGFDAYALPETEADVAAGFAHFGAVVVKVQRIDWLCLKARRNRRAAFDLETGEARWLAP